MSLEHQGENAELDDCSQIQSGWLPPALKDQKGEVHFSITMHNVAGLEYLRFKVVVHLKMNILSSVTHPHFISNLLDLFFCGPQKDILKDAPVSFIFIFCPYYESQTFFKTSSFFLQVYNETRVSKWWQVFGWTSLVKTTAPM